MTINVCSIMIGVRMSFECFFAMQTTHVLRENAWWFLSIGFMSQFLSWFFMVISLFLLFFLLRMGPPSIILSLQMQNLCWMRRSISKNNYLNGFVSMGSVIKNGISGLSLSLSSWIDSLALPRDWRDLLLLLCLPMVPGSRKNKHEFLHFSVLDWFYYCCFWL